MLAIYLWPICNSHLILHVGGGMFAAAPHFLTRRGSLSARTVLRVRVDLLLVALPYLVTFVHSCLPVYTRQLHTYDTYLDTCADRGV